MLRSSSSTNLPEKSINNNLRIIYYAIDGLVQCNLLHIYCLMVVCWRSQWRHFHLSIFLCSSRKPHSLLVVIIHHGNQRICLISLLLCDFMPLKFSNFGFLAAKKHLSFCVNVHRSLDREKDRILNIQWAAHKINIHNFILFSRAHICLQRDKRTSLYWRLSDSTTAYKHNMQTIKFIVRQESVNQSINYEQYAHLFTTCIRIFFLLYINPFHGSSFQCSSYDFRVCIRTTFCASMWESIHLVVLKATTTIRKKNVMCRYV